MRLEKKALKRVNPIDKQDLIVRKILEIAKKRGQTIYGAQSIKAQAGLFARPTKDFDIFDKRPKTASTILQKELDKIVGFDYYYNKPAKHKGTWKVKSKGFDMKKNTEDDESIADYSINEHGHYDSVMINGLRYRHLKNELERKKATLKDKEQEFRWKKDKDDVKRIKGYIKVRHLINGGNG